MSEKFKAIIIDNQNEKFTREVKEIDTSHLKDGNVLVKVDYSSLNFKDALILKDGGKIVRKFPFVPGIDFAGTVVESEDDKFKKNDNNSKKTHDFDSWSKEGGADKKEASKIFEKWKIEKEFFKS